MTSLNAAKAKLTLSDLWRLRGWPHESARECFAPFRPDDRRKSFSVFTSASGEELGKDFKSGDVFDAPALLAAVEGLDMREACRLFIELAGVKGEAHERHHGLRVPRARQIAALAAPAREKPSLPVMRAPTNDEAEQIARQRHVSPESVLYAAELGLLSVAPWRGFPAWSI